MKLELTQEQLYELNDAALEVIERMINDGQAEAEIKLSALPTLFEAFKAIHVAILGSDDTPAIRNLEPRVMAAMGAPRAL
ncbi:hypothetical protein [Diaphorobacter sp.]|uniref:hypothetical protein n=1 Tax=Diaphorobacter sp. TaxID=1934310 RepID=UPI002588AB0A|nr:hypothetical protein [Diaphorobacter sp.]